MFEKFKPNRNQERPGESVIVPVEGLEDRSYSLPEIGDSDSSVGLHKDDWYVTGETADDDANLSLTLSRYREDGSIETRTEIPADKFETYQIDVDAERRVKESRADVFTYIGETAVRTAIRNNLTDMVRKVRSDPTNEKFAGLAAIEKWTDNEQRKSGDERRSISLANIEEYRNAKRRENPLKKLQQGRHHAGR